MRRLARLFALPALLVLGGCFQVHSTLNIRSDGSAQLVERITMEGTMAMMVMAGDDFMSAFDMDGDSTAVEEEVTPEEALRRRFTDRAATLGEGVTVASVVEELAPGQLTYVVTYDVPDVNAFAYSLSDAADPDALFSGGSSEEMSDEDWDEADWEEEEWELDELPEGDMEEVIGDGEIIDEPGEIDDVIGDGEIAEMEGMDASSDMGMVEAEDANEPFRFAFTPATGGGPATLRVTVPGQPLDMDDMDLGQLASSDDPDQELKSAYVMFGRMAMTFGVVVEGELVSADRGWTDGNRVTLSALQMGEVLDFMRSQGDVGDIGALLAGQDPADGIDLPGLRFAGSGPVDIRFR